MKKQENSKLHCPHCRALLWANKELLTVRQVRCGRCHKVFDPLQQLTTASPAAPAPPPDTVARVIPNDAQRAETGRDCSGEEGLWAENNAPTARDAPQALSPALEFLVGKLQSRVSNIMQNSTRPDRDSHTSGGHAPAEHAPGVGSPPSTRDDSGAPEIPFSTPDTGLEQPMLSAAPNAATAGDTMFTAIPTRASPGADAPSSAPREDAAWEDRSPPQGVGPSPHPPKASSTATITLAPSVANIVRGYSPTHQDAAPETTATIEAPAAAPGDPAPPRAAPHGKTELPDIPIALLEELEAPAPSRRFAWTLLCFLLLPALLLQIAWFNRNILAARVPGAPVWLRSLCREIDCQPLREDFLDKLRILQRDVRNHPFRADILLVNILFRSDATGSIRYPALRLVLRDEADRPLHVYDRTPGAYLGDPIWDEAGLRPGHPVHVLLELPAPKQDILNYELSFL